MIEENANLKEKLNESEYYKKKFQEKNNQLDSIIKKLNEEK